MAQSLRLLHSPTTLRPSSLAYLRRRSTEQIVASLHPGSADPLIVRADGTIMSGNTRVYVLMERDYDVNSLPRTPYES
jgi:hypothetical protein